MISKISWRNIWRNRGRSSVVIGAIAIGIWALIFLAGFMNSWIVMYVKNQIKYETSHIQVHHPEFKKDYEIKYTIEDGAAMLDELRLNSNYQSIAHRSICNGMISSPRKASGINIKGIIPEEEMQLNDIDSFIIEGSYFHDVKRNPIVLGYKLAKKLKVKLRSKVVLTFQDNNGEIVAGAFRICGIIKTNSPSINEFSVQVRQKDLNKLLGIGDAFHEIAIIVKPEFDESAEANLLISAFPKSLIEDWKVLAPEMLYFQQASASFIWILQIIIMIALIFGIINTMLMSVLERFKELGMLMAVGMNKKRIFHMIMVETLYLAFVGSPIGLLLSILTMSYFENYGMDLSNYSAGLEMYGYDSILYPSVDNGTYIQVIIGVFITAIAGAIYPALKAIKLKPVEALHKI